MGVQEQGACFSKCLSVHCYITSTTTTQGPGDTAQFWIHHWLKTCLQANHSASCSVPVSPPEEKCVCVHTCVWQRRLLDNSKTVWFLTSKYYNLCIAVSKNLIDHLESSKHTQAAQMFSIQDLNKQTKNITHPKKPQLSWISRGWKKVHQRCRLMSSQKHSVHAVKIIKWKYFQDFSPHFYFFNGTWIWNSPLPTLPWFCPSEPASNVNLTKTCNGAKAWTLTFWTILWSSFQAIGKHSSWRFKLHTLVAVRSMR